MTSQIFLFFPHLHEFFPSIFCQPNSIKTQISLLSQFLCLPFLPNIIAFFYQIHLHRHRHRRSIIFFSTSTLDISRPSTHNLYQTIGLKIRQLNDNVVFYRPLTLKVMHRCFEFDNDGISTTLVWIKLWDLQLHCWNTKVFFFFFQNCFKGW